MIFQAAMVGMGQMALSPSSTPCSRRCSYARTTDPSACTIVYHRRMTKGGQRERRESMEA